MTAVIDVTEATFERDVLEASRSTTVVVDFWAAWCAPCRALGPVLERLAEDAQGTWRLAKVDVDSNQRLAQAFNVMGIPAVKAFRDGKQVSEFTGALPEAQVRAWLKQTLPDPALVIVEQAVQAETAGDLSRAEDLYRKAIEVSPENSEALAGIARLEAVQTISDSDEGELRQRLAGEPSDVETAEKLARLLAVRGDDDFHLPLIEVLRVSEDQEAARRALVELFGLLRDDDPRLVKARRDLSNVLY